MGNFKNTYSKLSTAPVKKYMSLTDGYKNLIVNKQNKFEFIPESFTISTTPIQSQVHKGGFFSESVICFSDIFFEIWRSEKRIALSEKSHL